MAGLARIAKLYGGIKVNGTNFVWDYVADVAVTEAEMPVGSERWKASERQRWTGTSAASTPPPPDEEDERF